MLTAVRYTAPGNTCENRIARPEDTQRQQTMLMPHHVVVRRARITSRPTQVTCFSAWHRRATPQPALQCCSREAVKSQSSLEGGRWQRTNK